ncbi:MAG: mycothiol synthase [Acidimicrobiales bacterium]
MDPSKPRFVQLPDEGERRAIADLVDRASAATCEPALGEDQLRALRRQPADPTEDPAAGPLVGAVLVDGTASGTRPTPGLCGSALLTAPRGTTDYVAELVVDPEVGDPEGTRDVLLDAVIGVVGDRGGGALLLWARRAGGSADERAEHFGFSVDRTLLQLRCPLPLPPSIARSPSGAADPTRSFVPGRDEPAWLEVNNRAFAGHPEQGGWDLATLTEREREPWFRPEGLRVLELDGRLVGSCWTKVHRDHRPPLGEIYVIAVDPAFHGRGFGRILARAGLEWLARGGLPVGMLYVDAANHAAVALYRALGFVEHHADRAYRIEVPGPAQPTPTR